VSSALEKRREAERIDFAENIALENAVFRGPPSHCSLSHFRDMECHLCLSTPGSRRPAAVSVSVQRATAEMLEGESKDGAAAKKVDDEKWHAAEASAIRIEHVK